MRHKNGVPVKNHQFSATIVLSHSFSSSEVIFFFCIFWIMLHGYKA